MPLVRLIVPFIAGIIIAIYFPYNHSFSFYFLFVLIGLLSIITLSPKYHLAYKNSWWFGVFSAIVLFMSAYQLTIYHTDKFNLNHYSKSVAENTLVHVKIIEQPVEKEKSMKVVAEVMELKQGNHWKKASGKSMLYFKKDSNALMLSYGDELVLTTIFKEVLPPQNPGEFNYKQYLSFHQIYQQGYVGSADWVFTGVNSGNTIRSLAIDLRNKLLTVLKKQNVNGAEFAVGAALLLGYEDKLDAETLSAYSSTGAMHVLSVSGLHVGIIFLVLNSLLFFTDKFKHGTIIKAIVLILCLWLYATITGLSPSVLRAATMFSFIIIGKSFKRYTNIYNTLAASAFLLLLINPYIIMEVGFQLSYLAVLGIVAIQPKIYDWIEFDNRLLDQIWSISSVSIAAQIATFPLGLHYFHQFPNYFLLSNLIVIPISTIIIYLGISLLFLAKMPIVVGVIAIGFTWSIWLLNASVKWIEKLPFALLDGISISVLETWLIYALIVSAFIYFQIRKYKILIFSLAVMVFVLFIQIIEQHEQLKQKKMVIYNVPKTSAVDFISGKQNVLLADSLFANNESRLLFHVKHNWWDLGVSSNQIVVADFKNEQLKIKNNAIQFYDKTMVIVNKNSKLVKNVDASIEPLLVDILLISHNPKTNIKNLLKLYKPKQIVFDSSCTAYYVNKWKEECEYLQQNYYSIIDSGALEIVI